MILEERALLRAYSGAVEHRGNATAGLAGSRGGLARRLAPSPRAKIRGRRRRSLITAPFIIVINHSIRQLHGPEGLVGRRYNRGSRHRLLSCERADRKTGRRSSAKAVSHQ
jgi:hypothetical protein